MILVTKPFSQLLEDYFKEIEGIYKRGMLAPTVKKDLYVIYIYDENYLCHLEFIN